VNIEGTVLRPSPSDDDERPTPDAERPEPERRDVVAGGVDG
jgi:hypothetical protein